MCGICGKIEFDPSIPVDEALVRRMADTLAHRGPDGSGAFVGPGVGLGHRRLSIIDLSDRGRQPMSNGKETLWIVFNGEIYNFRELRKELEAEGLEFRSDSDTEVLLRLYEKDGERCVRRLRGQFAFAVWNARDRTLFLARDRAGKKPLFYLNDGRRFIFGSEPKAILADLSVPVEADLEAIDDYLTYQYVPAPRCAFKGLKKLPPAHTLFLDAKGRMRVERYWKLDFSKKTRAGKEDVVRELRDKLENAVRERMIADVPLGAFLSGGVDSSAVVAYMAKNSAAPVKTFSIGFKQKEYDETRYARIVAERFKTDHREFVVDPSAAEIFDELVWHYNEPFADSSAVPSYYVARETRRCVTVALNGDGGDESFAGYERYLWARTGFLLDKIPDVLRKGVGLNLLRLLEKSRADDFFFRARQFAEKMFAEPQARYHMWIGHFAKKQKESLLSGDLKRTFESRDAEALFADAYRQAGGGSFIDKFLESDIYTYLPGDLLVKMDIATMTHSLEGRSPFLDHDLMQFAASLPPEFKLRGKQGKWILKEAMRGVLPDEILDRPKLGFGVPIAYWFRNELKGFMYETLLSQKAKDRGWFDPAQVKALLDDHASGRKNRHYLIWNLLMLELWCGMFVDQAIKAR